MTKTKKGTRNVLGAKVEATVRANVPTVCVWEVETFFLEHYFLPLRKDSRA